MISKLIGVEVPGQARVVIQRGGKVGEVESGPSCGAAWQRDYAGSGALGELLPPSWACGPSAATLTCLTQPAMLLSRGSHDPTHSCGGISGVIPCGDAQEEA